MMTLWKADNRFVENYMTHYPGYYQTSDAGYIDEDGYIHIMSRTDDIINVAGHRLSTGGIEAELSEHPDVAESAVIGVNDDLKGQIPLGFLVLNSGVDTPRSQIIRHVIEYVRENIGPVASSKTQSLLTDCRKPVQENPSRNHEKDSQRRTLRHSRNNRRPCNT